MQSMRCIRQMRHRSCLIEVVSSTIDSNACSDARNRRNAQRESTKFLSFSNFSSIKLKSEQTSTCTWRIERKWTNFIIINYILSTQIANFDINSMLQTEMSTSTSTFMSSSQQCIANSFESIIFSLKWSQNCNLMSSFDEHRPTFDKCDIKHAWSKVFHRWLVRMHALMLTIDIMHRLNLDVVVEIDWKHHHASTGNRWKWTFPT